MFNKLFKILDKKEKNFFFILLFFILVNAVFETIGVAAIVPLIGLVTQDNFLGDYNYLSNILLNICQIVLPEELFENNSVKNNLVIGGAVIFVIIFFIKAIIIISQNFLQTTFVSNLHHSISKKLYEGYLNLDYIFHTARNSSNLKQNILTEAAHFTSLFNSILVVIAESIILFSIVILLLIYDFSSTIIIIVFLLSISFLIFKSTRSKVSSWGNIRLNYLERRFKNLQEALEGVKEIYIFQKPLYFINNFSEFSRNYLTAHRNFLVIQSITRPIFELIGILVIVLLLLFLLFQGNSIGSLVTTIGLFLAASFRLLPSINKILSNVQQLKFFTPSIENILKEFKIINESYKLADSNINIEFKKNIILDNVTFFYPNKNKAAVQDINFVIEKGKKYGIRGSSGSGKSTLISLILTLLKPLKGQIKVDDVNLESNNIFWLKNIGYVAQDIYLMDDTIEKNIAFGIPQNQIDSEKINIAIKNSQLSDFVDNLKNGVKTRVGERGQMISGGQKQRMGIARALYNDPSLIILDEFTSALDKDTEKHLIDTIYNLDKSKTVVIVSHRESALDRCDTIIDLEDGKIKKIYAQ